MASGTSSSPQSDITHGGSFLYFGFGSNMFAKRIHLQNPSAVFRAIARLDDHKLDFGHKSKKWFGSVATLDKSPGDHLWGVVWKMRKCDSHQLDKQEGALIDIYQRISVTVTTDEGENLTCRAYSLIKHDIIDKRPSPQYLDIMIRGAVEHNLPEYYIAQLRTIETNGYSGPMPVYDELVGDGWFCQLL